MINDFYKSIDKQKQLEKSWNMYKDQYKDGELAIEDLIDR